MGGMTRRATLGAAVAMMAGALTGCSATPGDGHDGHLTIESGSMQPLLVTGQVISVDGVVAGEYRPHRQDIVVFRPPIAWPGLDHNALIVRRVIGIPGDRVSCAGAGRPVKVNGTALSEPYLYQGDAPSAVSFDVVVPSGRLWLLGDHRSVAIDCRYELSIPDDGAFVPVSSVVGTYIPPGASS